MPFKRLELNVIELSSVDSTNNYAANLIKTQNTPNGTTILTKRQNNGKGQRGNGWISEPKKNLIQSTIIFPHLPVAKSFYLNIAVSLTIYKTLADFGIQSTVKWPNDIYCGEKKIAGILIETQIQGKKIKSAILGIGLNVNQTVFDASVNATSMQLEKKFVFEVDRVFQLLYKQLDFYLDVLLQGNYPLLLKHYYANLFRIGVKANYADKTGEFLGVIKGINDNGELQVLKNDRVVTYDLKEIKFLLNR